MPAVLGGSYSLWQTTEKQLDGVWPTQVYVPVTSYGLYGWGNNDSYKLVQGDTIARSSPVQIGSATTWTNLAIASNGVVATKADGTLWAWGDYLLSGYPVAAPYVYTSPVQVGSSSTWSKISTSYGHALAIQTNGTLWAWGQNGGSGGQLGLGNITSYSSPKQVGALTNWATLAENGMGYNFSAAIKTDGTLWTWGKNDWGQQGVGDTITRSSPVQVGALTNWAKVETGTSTAFPVFAIKTDGTLWSWGLNYKGALGLGDTINRSSPVQVGALTNWSSIKGTYNGAVAIKTDGTLWSWGENYRGCMGVGDTISRSSPVQVGALTDWLRVSGGGYHVTALRTNGTLWSWGYNGQGQLGFGNTTNYSSPKQVGALTTWALLGRSNAGQTSIALTTA